MKEIPISKIYEALSAIADKRVKKIDENQYLVISSDKSKAYTVILDGKIASSNDNATYWQHYAGYPILACYLYEGKLDYDKKLLSYFENISWKKLNVENKNNYDKSIEQAFKTVDKETMKRIEMETNHILKTFMTYDLTIKGNRKKQINNSLS